MIRQPNWVRDRLLRLIDQMLFQFDSSVSMLPILESDIRNALVPSGRLVIAEDMARDLMRRFGHEVTPPKQARFDKVRRAHRRKIKVPRGTNYKTTAERRTQKLLQTTSHKEAIHAIPSQENPTGAI